MKIRQIDCKTALSPSRLPGLDYSLNPYRGCEHNCAYCYVPNVDPYQPVEEKYELTRYCLEQLLMHDFPICIQTKSNLIVRDIDIISKFSDAEVMVSIATLNDVERKLLEPNSSSIDERLDVIRKCSGEGIGKI